MTHSDEDLAGGEVAKYGLTCRLWYTAAFTSCRVGRATRCEFVLQHTALRLGENNIIRAQSAGQFSSMSGLVKRHRFFRTCFDAKKGLTSQAPPGSSSPQRVIYRFPTHKQGYKTGPSSPCDTRPASPYSPSG